MADIVGLAASNDQFSCFPQKVASYIGPTGYYGWEGMLSYFPIGWFYGVGNIIECIFPIIDTTGSYRVPDSCKTVMGLEVPYQDSARAYVLWERGRFNSSWEVTVATDYALRSVAIYDMQGHKVLDSEAEGFTASLDIAALPQGSYIVVVLTAQGRSTQKLLIER